VQQHVGTVAVVNLISAQQISSGPFPELMQMYESLLAKMAEASARSNGKVLGVSASEVRLAWNVVSPCPTHTVRSQLFLQYIMDQNLGVNIGTASGLLFHGHIAAGRQQFQDLLGPALELSRRAAVMCPTFHAKALSIFMPETPAVLEMSLRPLDIWSFGGALLTVEEPTNLTVKETDILEWGECSISSQQEKDSDGMLQMEYRQAFLGSAKGDVDKKAKLAAIVDACTDEDKGIKKMAELMPTYAKPEGPGYRVLVASEEAASSLRALRSVRESQHDVGGAKLVLPDASHSSAPSDHAGKAAKQRPPLRSGKANPRDNSDNPLCKPTTLPQDPGA